MTFIMSALIYFALWAAFPRAWGLAHLALLTVTACTIVTLAVA